MRTLYDWAFGCWHTHITFPITKRQERSSRTYVVCLDCGKELPYNWETMKIEKKQAA